tara:strand:- start:131 stop:382 length:252 start_codon:yes stop_codon:yes gene_type:complete
MKVNITYKNIELDLDAMAVTKIALDNYELKISKIINDLKVRQNAADSPSEIREIQVDLKQAVNVVRDIKRSKEILSTAKSEIL